VAVCSHLAEPGERITRTDLAGLAGGTFDPLSVVVLRGEEGAGERSARGKSGTITS
jgi:precorrin-6B methylase 1